MQQNLESRHTSNANDEEILPFEPSASASKQAKFQDYSPQPFSPAQQTPQKYVQGDLSMDELDQQARSVAHGRKLNQLVSANVNQSANSGNNTKNSNIIREKHKQMQKLRGGNLQTMSPPMAQDFEFTAQNFNTPNVQVNNYTTEEKENQQILNNSNDKSQEVRQNVIKVIQEQKKGKNLKSIMSPQFFFADQVQPPKVIKIHPSINPGKNSISAGNLKPNLAVQPKQKRTESVHLLNPNKEYSRYAGFLQQQQHQQNIQKIQSLELSSSSNTLERDLLPEVNRELEADLNEAAQCQRDDETVNELTMNNMIMHQEPSQNIFTNKEREYDTAQLEKRNSGELLTDKHGPPDSQNLQAPNFIVQLRINQANSESNQVMRTTSNNEHTSSSLGKRNFNDFISKGQNASGKKQVFTSLHKIDESEGAEVEKRHKKTPARKYTRRGIQRQNSDIFGADQVQESGKKLLDQKNDDSSNIQLNINGIQGQLSALGKIEGQKSDIQMSCYDGDGTYGDGTYEGFFPQIKFQNMGLNGHSIQMQKDHHGSSFDQESCPGCAQEKRSSSTINSVLHQHQTNFANHQNLEIPQGKDTPNFIKQNFKKTPIVINATPDSNLPTTVTQFNLHQTVNNNFQNMVCVQQQQQQQQAPLMQSSLQLAIENHTACLQSDPQSVRRQLFRSVSSSSNIETPGQQKRMKCSIGQILMEESSKKSRVFEIAKQTQTLFQQEGAMFGDQKPLVMQKSFTTKEGGSSPQSWLQRWRLSDPVFREKYSSGATPPQKWRQSKAGSIRDFNGNQTMPKQQLENFGRTFSHKDLKNIHSEGSGEVDSNNGQEQKNFFQTMKTQIQPPQILDQNVKQQQPFVVQPPQKFEKTLSSCSVHTCQKRRSTIQDPRTPVQNNRGEPYKRTSQISVTNTSMNDHSVISSSLDGDGQYNPYGKKGMPPLQVRQFVVPQSQKQFQNLIKGGSSSPAKTLNLTQSNLQQQFNIFQTNNPPKKVSWLDKEFIRLSILGRGHFGQVLRCQNKTDKFEYAIKVTKNPIRNPSEQEYYLQEMQTLSALSVEAECPHIVRYFNSWIEDDRIHIVMELCEKSLRQIKRDAKVNGLIPEYFLRKIIRDVLLGMQELHSVGIVHLDIKPENILEGKTGNFKLADLGMARFLAKITEDINIPEGDCRYLAKELLSRTVLNFLPDLQKSDIFSLGITAYELITLESLEKNGPEWRALRDGSFDYPQETKNVYSPELLNSIRMMLAPNTCDRPSADDLLQSVFVSSEQRRINQLKSEKQQMQENQQKLLEFLRQQGFGLEQLMMMQNILQSNLMQNQ